MQKQNASNVKNALTALALVVFLGACATIETRYISPDCEVQPRPSLPSVDAGELWDLVGDDVYRVIETRDARLTDWALELEAGMRVLCE